MLLLCTGWVAKLGGRERVEQLPPADSAWQGTSYWWHIGVAPTAFIDIDIFDHN